MSDEGLQAQHSIKSFFELFFLFFKIGFVTFGGGMGMFPILERELIEKRNWTTAKDLMDYYAIGQSTPGIIAVNVATFLGYKRGGVVGACLTTAGIITPSIIVITILSHFISEFSHIVWVQKALSGINVAVAALLTKAVISFSKNAVVNSVTLVIYIVAFLLFFIFKINSIFIIMGGILLGILFFFIKKDSMEQR